MSYDRSRPPAPLPRRPFTFPAFTSETWASGLRVYACPQREFPLLCIEALSKGGAERDPAGLEGLAALHAELLDEGTARRSALEIAHQVEYLGGGIMTGCGWNGVSAEVLTLGEHVEPALDLVADCWRNAAFPDHEVARLREENLADLQQRRVQPAALADDAFARAVYRDTPYGRPLLGHAEALGRIGVPELAGFRDRYLSPGNSALLLVGDFDPDLLRGQLEPLFADWPAAPAPADVEIAPRLPERVEIHLVDRPGAAQTQLQLGQAGLPRRHPDFHALQLLNVIFGGKFTSRINLSLRERHGLTYSAYGHLVPRRGPGPYFVRTAVGTDKTGLAIRELLAGLERLCAEPVTADEVREAQDYVIGVFPSTVQSIHEIAQRLETLFFFDLPDDFYGRFPAVFAELGPEDLLAAARRHLRPDRVVVALAGEARALLPQLEGLGDIHVHTA